jgi:acyl phosphate:glycerol-3-phosphate acyltransferase
LAYFFIILGYMLGSISPAYLAGKWLKGIDIRRVGDGNAGAANVFREISPTAGLFVMAADVCKGAATPCC